MLTRGLRWNGNAAWPSHDTGSDDPTRPADPDTAVQIYKYQCREKHAHAKRAALPVVLVLGFSELASSTVGSTSIAHTTYSIPIPFLPKTYSWYFVLAYPVPGPVIGRPSTRDRLDRPNSREKSDRNPSAFSRRLQVRGRRAEPLGHTHVRLGHQCIGGRIKASKRPPARPRSRLPPSVSWGAR